MVSGICKGKRWCFTKNNPGDFRLLVEQVEMELSIEGTQLTYLLAGRETGRCGTPHWQGMLVLTVRKTLTTLKRWLNLRIPALTDCHLERMRGTIAQNVAYCSKQDLEPFQGGNRPEEDRPGARTDLHAYAEAVLSGKGELELAVEYPTAHARYHKYSDRLKKEKREEDTRVAMKARTNQVVLRDWQRRVVSKLDEQDDRKILWVWSRQGNVGKTWLGLYLVGQKDAFMCNTGKHADIIHAFQKRSYSYCVMDLTREQEDRAPYTVMEGMKNGFLFSAKYDSGMHFFTPLKLVVFANFEPDRVKLSEDRWDVMSIVRPERG